ncbi:MAG: hypothetical protein AAFX94_22075, partial [Myxococcota bacterium]
MVWVFPEMILWESDVFSKPSVLVFFLDADQDHWLQKGIATLLHHDLLQDLFIDVRSPYQNKLFW